METESSHLPLDLVVLSLSLFVHTSRKQRQPATAFPAPRLSTLYVSVSVSVHVSVLTLNCFWLARRSAPGVWGNLRFELQLRVPLQAGGSSGWIRGCAQKKNWCVPPSCVRLCCTISRLKKGASNSNNRRPILSVFCYLLVVVATSRKEQKTKSGTR